MAPMKKRKLTKTDQRFLKDLFSASGKRLTIKMNEIFKRMLHQALTESSGMTTRINDEV
jgi:hypothetical protein